MNTQSDELYADLEDGEISNDDSDDCYIPLERPKETAPPPQPIVAPMNTVQSFTEDEESTASSSSSDSNDCFKEKRKKRRTILARTSQHPQASSSEGPESKPTMKRFNVWTTTIQEDSLSENMRGFGVDADSRNDRSVENYDFQYKQRLEGGGVKRHLSSGSEDSRSEGSEGEPSYKKYKNLNHTSTPTQRRSIKDRLGPPPPSPASSDHENKTPVYLADIGNSDYSQPDVIGREIAQNLHEEKDDLVIRSVHVLGPELAIQIYNETKSIEADGGVMIINRKRRRTPGGVYFNLLKVHEKVTKNQRTLIFYEDSKEALKHKRMQQAMKRDQKVKELKKRLTEKDNLSLPNTLSSSSSENSANNLSNPPPSPVVGQENSPEYKSHAINPDDSNIKIEEDCEKTARDSGLIISYDDDVIDITCDDMDIGL